MNVISALPSKPLNSCEQKRLRARNEVEALIVVGTTLIYNRRSERTENATNMVMLTGGVVYALEYNDFEWSIRILQWDADQRDHLERALDQLSRQ